MSMSGIVITRIIPLICRDHAKAHLTGKKVTSLSRCMLQMAGFSTTHAVQGIKSRGVKVINTISKYLDCKYDELQAATLPRRFDYPHDRL